MPSTSKIAATSPGSSATAFLRFLRLGRVVSAGRCVPCNQAFQSRAVMSNGNSSLSCGNRDSKSRAVRAVEKVAVAEE